MDSEETLKIISQKYHDHTTSSALTISICGIDPSGKEYVAKLLQSDLEKQIRLKIIISDWI